MKKKQVLAAILVSSGILLGQVLLSHNASADTPPPTDTPIADNSSTNVVQPEATVTGVTTSGEPDTNATGSAVFAPIEIVVEGEDMTSDNFLTPAGLGWSEQTQVVPIQGSPTGAIDSNNFGASGPDRGATSYTINEGDSGRITYVGQTLSGKNIDLIYSVVSSDTDNWQAYNDPNGAPYGLAFTGSQYIAGGAGNSLVALYNGANSLSLIYKVVEHDTFNPLSVVVSFITTDIDMGQGVETNLANITQYVPQGNLRTDGNIIYDSMPILEDLNGERSLPNGGYLGAGLVSEFYYNFYAPAPARSEDTYFFAQGVRYDLFGSSLQAHLTTQVRQHMTVLYIDEAGNTIAPTDYYLGFTGQDYNLPIPPIDGYGFITMSQNKTIPNNPVIVLTYTKEVPMYENRGFVGNQIYNQAQTYTPALTVGYQNSGQTINSLNYIPANQSQTLLAYHPTGSTSPIQLSSSNVDYNKIDKNSGLTSQQAKDVLSYIRQVYDKAQGDMAEKNRAAAAALAKNDYADDFAQRRLVDYNDIPNVVKPGSVEDLLKNTNGKGSILHTSPNIDDLPHIMTAYAAAKQEGNTGLLGSLLLGFSSLAAVFGFAVDVRKTKLYGDTFYGDAMSAGNGGNDERADQIAWILYNHPDYRNLSLPDALEKFYSQNYSEDDLKKLTNESFSGIKGPLGQAMGKAQSAAMFAMSMTTAGGFYALFNRAKDLTTDKGRLQLIAGVVPTINKVVNVVATKVGQAAAAIKQGFDQTVQVASRTFNAFVEKAKEAGVAVKQFVSMGVKAAQQGLQKTIDFVKEQAAAAARWVQNAAQTVWNGTVGAYNTVVQTASNVVHAVGNFVGGVINTVVSTAKKVVNAVKGAVNSVVNWVRKLW